MQTGLWTYFAQAKHVLPQHLPSPPGQNGQGQLPFAGASFGADVSWWQVAALVQHVQDFEALRALVFEGGTSTAARCAAGTTTGKYANSATTPICRNQQFKQTPLTPVLIIGRSRFQDKASSDDGERLCGSTAVGRNGNSQGSHDAIVFSLAANGIGLVSKHFVKPVDRNARNRSSFRLPRWYPKHARFPPRCCPQRNEPIRRGTRRERRRDENCGP